MHLGGRFTYWYYASRFTQIAAVVGLGIFSAAQPINVASWNPILAQPVQWLQQWGKLALPLLTAIMVLTQWACYMIGPPWVWSAVIALLNEFREHAFSDDASGDPVHHHRVTLFKFVRWKWLFPLRCWRARFWPWGNWRWPRSGWLVPVCRSGHTTMSRVPIYLAPDDADFAEGIAGRTWAANQVVSVADLPSLKGNPSDADVTNYAKRSFVSEHWIRRRSINKVFPRSLHGIPVEVKGKLWGVVVLDSRLERGIRLERATRLISVLAATLDKLLERVK